MISRSAFRAMMNENTILLDGGYGTSFFEMGLGNIPAELLNLEHPDRVEELHRSYVDAGAEMLLTNTFGGNRIKLSENSLEGRIRDIHHAAVSIARRAAASRPVLVFGDISSTGRFPAPSGEGSFDECRAVYAEQASLLLEAGCDGLIVETMTDIKELKATLVGIREISADVPLIAQMAFDASGATLTGASLEVFAAVMADLDVDVIGMNCQIGPAEMLANIKRLASVTGALLSASPNAGDPYFDGRKTVYRTDAAEFAMYVEEFVESGASIIGGCCGTNSDHIRAASALLRNVVPAGLRRREVKSSQNIASRTSVFDLSSAFCVIGERINPTGRKALRESMRAGDWGVMTDEAAAQVREGADVLDVNFGVEKFFTCEGVADALISLDQAVSVPFSLDIQTHELMESALREYPGRPLINSSACDEESLSKKLPLLKKYGGIMILLAMKNDISPDPLERFSVVENALKYAESMGLGSDRFIVDPLVMPQGAGYGHRTTLEVIKLCSDKGLRTVVGLSNLSHGMPNRSGINAAFLSQAIECGLSGAIMNSGDSAVMETLFGALLLKTGKLEDRTSEMELPPLVSALLTGNRKAVDSIVDEKLTAGMMPLEISQDVLGGAMESIGALYEEKRIFLPHILFAAETSFPVFDRLNGMMTGEGASRGRVMIATVEGDIHDIGKNIVGTVLRAGGFGVTDIGKNVTAAEIVRRAEELKPDIIGLSAMMTTTVGRIQEVSQTLKSAGINTPVISGGASMNPELADLFGVRYSKDSSGALALCKELAQL